MSLAEIEKIKEIGNESVSPDDSTKCRSEASEANVVDLESHDSCSSGHSVKQILLSSMELQVAILTEKINISENKLEELPLGIAGFSNLNQPLILMSFLRKNLLAPYVH